MLATIATQVSQRVTTYMGLRVTDEPAGTDAWERWSLIWHVIFYGSLLGTLGVVLIDGSLPASTQAFISGVSLIFGASYWWFVIRHQDWHETPVMLLHMAFALLFFIVLTEAHPAFILLTNSLFIQVFTLLRFRWSIPSVLILLSVIMWVNSRMEQPELTPFLLTLSILVTLLFAVGLALYLHAIVEQSRDRRRLIEELQATRRNLAAEERRSGILEERQRLAREIHDTLAQQFGSITMLLAAAESAMERDTGIAHAHLTRAEETAREGLAEARRLVWALRPEALEQVTLASAIEQVAERWSYETGIAVKIAVTGHAVENLHPEIEVALLRTVQEALTNVRKHANATSVTLTLSYLDDQVALDVVDDGRGFDQQHGLHGNGHADGGGFGLIGMSERASLLGGELAIESEPGSGTAISLSVPLRPAGLVSA